MAFIPMEIVKNTVVTFHYNLQDLDNQQIESSRDGDPTLALIGANNMIVGLEQAMIGKKTGDKFEVSIEPHAAYGIRNKENTRRVPAKYLKHEGKLKKGQTVRLDSDQGVKICTVLKVGKFNVDVDMNHPLAGKSIRYTVDIIDVREASDEETAHGHAHGAGGHHH